MPFEVQGSSAAPVQPSRFLITAAWTVLLLGSLLPNILWQELTGQGSRWMFYGKVILLAVLLIASFAVRAIRPLRNYFGVLLAIYAVEEVFSWFGGQNAPFVSSMIGSISPGGG